ncbi:hypothetical protein CBER1_04528 [Cercospora berteroae]|uniref:F-box domain-containing protein n=1 Tax=Cercospora berteroae TaxID=357750 RepID=A0A2S6CF26_9PEZI|nr:hypothetical protein CBER1_04528 [Cercospora berteroae]
MSFNNFRCVICGYYICRAERWIKESWVQELRTVYWEDGEPHVTGIGLCVLNNNDEDEALLAAPRNPDKIWHSIGLEEETVTMPVMTQKPDDGAHGYALHAACWSLLETYVAPQKIDTARLLKVCGSVPYYSSCDGLAWEHRYDEFLSRDNEMEFLWGRDYGTTSSAPHADFRLMEASYANADPEHPMISLPDDYVAPQPPHRPRGNGSGADGFAQFPLELLEMIAVLLPTRDVFHLRYTSRSFLPIFESKSFWKSRFQKEGDRGFLFDLLAEPEKVDFRALWRPSAENRRLSNRRRIWSILQEVVQLMDMKISVVKAKCGSRPPKEDEFIEVSANIQQQTSFFRHDALFGLTAAPNLVPSKYHGLRGSCEYQCRRSSVSIGYTSRQFESFEVDAEVTGFIIAMGARGLHGIRILTAAQKASPWPGDPTGTPITGRLLNVRPISNLGIQFDGFKIISRYVKSGKAIDALVGLQKQAIWYPRVPQPSLHVQDQHQRYPPDFQPIFWTQFGGARGNLLKHLTSVSISRQNSICGISFDYADTAPATTRLAMLGYPPDEYSCGTKRFSVDGPAGERITSITAGIGQCRGQDVLWSLKIKTSSDREFVCEPEIRPAREPATPRTVVNNDEALRQFLGYPDASYPDPNDPYADDGVPSDDEYAFLRDGDPDSDDFNFDYFVREPIEWQEPQVPPTDDAAITGVYVIQDPVVGFTKLGTISETAELDD